MSTYRIDCSSPVVILTPCTTRPSSAPGKMLCINEDGSTVCVEPGGEYVRNIPAGDPNWDSPYTQGEMCGDTLVYRSTFPEGKPGTPRGFIIKDSAIK